MSSKPKTARVLVVDDHEDMASGLADYLADHGYDAEAATSGEAALDRLGRSSFDAVISDLKMPGMDGLTLVNAVHGLDSTIVVFIMTAFGSIESAIEAVKAGAFHYFSKPLKSEEVLVFLERGLEHRRLKLSQSALLEEARERYTFQEMVGRSPQMRQIFDLIERVADTNASVLITGESGTGKELIAKAIHYRGPRAKGSLVPLNCSAIPAHLLESELFGYERGAFTGAAKPRRGLAVEASGGTLFLDEIGDMPVEIQPKLLRLLQEGEVRPLGSDTTRYVDVRIIAATHADIEGRVKAQRFRQDLFYRLNVVPIDVPPLRARREDIPMLCERLLERLRNRNTRLRAIRLSPEAGEALLRYDWPGNVRELENVLERAATLCAGEIITDADLRFLQEKTVPAAAQDLTDAYLPLREMERRYIDRVLQSVGGSKVKAAAILGVDPSTLYRKGKLGSKT